MLYAEIVEKPHQLLRESGVAVMPLFNSLRRDIYTDGESTVIAVQKHVQQTLRRPDDKIKIDSKYGDVIEAMAGQQITNCLGYTLLTSECLDVAAVPNVIVYANGHAFNVALLGSDEEPQIRSIDSFWPEVDQEITKSLRHINPQSITDLLHNNQPRAVGMLDTAQIAAGKGTTVENLQGKNPWLKGLARVMVSWRSESGEEERYKYQRDNQIVASFYAPTIGRMMLKNYAAFKGAVNRGKHKIAYEHLLLLQDVYPDIEARSKHAHIKTLVKGFIAGQETALANQAIEAYCKNFAGEDCRLLALEGGLYRLVAYTGDQSAAEKMVTAYDKALGNARYAKSMYAGKLRKGQSIKDNLR